MVGLLSIYRHDALNQSWVNVGPLSVTLAHIQHGAKHDTVTQYWANVGSASKTVDQHETNIDSTSRVSWAACAIKTAGRTDTGQTH